MSVESSKHSNLVAFVKANMPSCDKTAHLYQQWLDLKAAVSSTETNLLTEEQASLRDMCRQDELYEIYEDAALEVLTEAIIVHQKSKQP